MDNMWPLCNGPQCACKRVTAHLNKKKTSEQDTRMHPSAFLRACSICLLMHARNDSFIRDMTHSYVTSLIHM